MAACSASSGMSSPPAPARNPNGALVPPRNRPPALWSLFTWVIRSRMRSRSSSAKAALYRRAVGYSYDTVKIMGYEGEYTHVPYVAHLPPDTTACIFWLKTRRRQDWRDRVDVAGLHPPTQDARSGRRLPGSVGLDLRIL